MSEHESGASVVRPDDAAIRAMQRELVGRTVHSITRERDAWTIGLDGPVSVRWRFMAEIVSGRTQAANQVGGVKGAKVASVEFCRDDDPDGDGDYWVLEFDGLGEACVRFVD